MKKILLSTVALAGLTAGAMAADLPSRRMAPAPYVAVPVFTWTGFYVGVNAGYGFSDSNNSNSFGSGLSAVGPTVTPVVPAIGVFGDSSRNNRDGFVGGGQLGYNYQIGSFVIGIEGDIQYTDFGNKRQSGAIATAIPNANIAGVLPGAAGNVAFYNRQGSTSDYFGTVRGRIGYAFDRVLVYGTGGVALRDTGSNNGNQFFGLANNYGRVANNVNFNSGNRGSNIVGVTNVNVPIVGATTRSREDDFAIVRAGVNYKFNLF